MQFEAQHTHYLAHYPHASYDCIEQEGVVVGRLYVDRDGDELRLIDICLFPNHQQCGIGGVLLKKLIEEANRKQQKLTAHVEQNNHARAWYGRLGFTEVTDLGIYIFMVKTVKIASMHLTATIQ